MGSAALVATHQTVLFHRPGQPGILPALPHDLRAAPEATVGTWRPIPIGDEDNALVVGAGNDGPSVLPGRGVRQASRWPQSQLLVGICVVGDTFWCSLDRVGM